MCTFDSDSNDVVVYLVLDVDVECGKDGTEETGQRCEVTSGDSWSADSDCGSALG